jgi:hypothetical protein
MTIHHGHPEKYMDIQDKMGVIVYDFKIKELSDDEVEKVRI